MLQDRSLHFVMLVVCISSFGIIGRQRYRIHAFLGSHHGLHQILQKSLRQVLQLIMLQIIVLIKAKEAIKEDIIIKDIIEEAIKEDIICLLYTSDAADEEDSVDLGGRRIIKKKKRD
eukprot:TRINITY_DN1126_c0_g1_i7.p4 TRINITY_DN1126_c0_g1~~TRINITY_DN1126_c0_g1_i7.p4  ORF type:complete len:117 (+),score=18.18 TRINITY_DN1126_c0_g1_i7:153-503(+)